MKILRSTAVEFTPAQKLNKLGAYRYALDRHFADCGRRQGKLNSLLVLKSTAVWGIPILFENKLMAYRYRAFCSGRHMIETCPKLSCLTALIRFFCLKGRGSFKKSFKKCGNVENLKAYRLIPPMTPLFNGWTIPLSIGLDSIPLGATGQDSALAYPRPDSVGRLQGFDGWIKGSWGEGPISNISI